MKIIFDTSFSVSKFPSETQILSFTFGTRTYDALMIEVDYVPHRQPSTSKFMGDAINLPNEIPSVEWKTLGSFANISTIYNPCCPDEPYETLTFYLKVERRGFIYYFTIVPPLAILTLLPPLIFLFPIMCNQKLLFGTFNLVALLVLKSQLNENAQYFYGGYQFFLSILHFLILLITLVIERIYSRTSQMPIWLKKGFQSISKIVLLEWPTPGANFDAPLILETSLDAIDRDGSLNQLAVHFKEKDRINALAEDWKHSANSLDRMFGLVFTFVSICSLGILLS
jgi:hypothetical protein